MPRPTRRRAAWAVAGLAAMMATLPATASAHISPDPAEAQAGSRQTVGFTVEHGCDGSPTIQLDMRLPEGTSSPEPLPPTGWSAEVDGDVVTFAGGSLPPDEPDDFRITMVLPPTPDTTVYFPFVQRCEDGEIRWIGIPDDGSGEDLDEPAPAMRLVGPVATTTTEAPPDSGPPDTESPSPATTTAPTETGPVVTDPAEPDPTEPPDTDPPPATVVTTDDSGSDDGGVPWVAVAAGGALLALAVLAFVVVRRRR